MPAVSAKACLTGLEFPQVRRYDIYGRFAPNSPVELIKVSDENRGIQHSGL